MLAKFTCRPRGADTDHLRKAFQGQPNGEAAARPMPQNAGVDVRTVWAKTAYEGLCGGGRGAD
eukprot:scaffold658522_cov67-Prasinocladus_malaysianus.AAC.1